MESVIQPTPFLQSNTHFQLSCFLCLPPRRIKSNFTFVFIPCFRGERRFLIKPSFHLIETPERLVRPSGFGVWSVGVKECRQPSLLMTVMLCLHALLRRRHGCYPIFGLASAIPNIPTRRGCSAVNMSAAYSRPKLTLGIYSDLH
jgi:hypothetical protein